MEHCGIDLHGKSSAVAVVDEAGELVGAARDLLAVVGVFRCGLRVKTIAQRLGKLPDTVSRRVTRSAQRGVSEEGSGDLADRLEEKLRTRSMRASGDPATSPDLVPIAGFTSDPKRAGSLKPDAFRSWASSPYRSFGELYATP